jgi:hypothetical protein
MPGGPTNEIMGLGGYGGRRRDWNPLVCRDTRCPTFAAVFSFPPSTQKRVPSACYPRAPTREHCESDQKRFTDYLSLQVIKRRNRG